MMEDIKEREDKGFMFLRVRRGKVRSEDLEKEIKIYNEGFEKMFKRKKVGCMGKGYVRKLEISYKKKGDDYNGDFEVLIGVNK
ncbi:protein rep [Staphylococcus warneri]|uniref:protein rep n=1 Tax=Staphylococcus warneri TaxID=1292 RepID=UPI0028CB86E3|nr:protein rep [Staphylococcus warneri]